MHRLDKPLRGERDAHTALCATYATRKAQAANVSRVLTRHASQRVAKRTLGFAPIVCLSLAAIIGSLLSLSV